MAYGFRLQRIIEIFKMTKHLYIYIFIYFVFLFFFFLKNDYSLHLATIIIYTISKKKCILFSKNYNKIKKCFFIKNTNK